MESQTLNPMSPPGAPGLRNSASLDTLLVNEPDGYLLNAYCVPGCAERQGQRGDRDRKTLALI